MPPKKQDKKNDKKADKIIVDKTFGMKNKKGGKAQKHIAMMQAQAGSTGKSKEQLAKEKKREAELKAKEAELQQKKEVAALFTQTPQKVPFGTDPKSVLCQYFKAGYCEKGKKCKFSHDMDVGRKAEKKDLYSDARAEKEKDTMDKWDQAKLSEVVLSKHGNKKTTTDIVCKHFIDAIQDGKYGWFWICPNGDDCKYRHALPPGFVLKEKGKKKQDDQEEETITLEEFLETARHKLGPNLTPVTKESFAVWKKTRMDKKAAEQEAIEKAKQSTALAGKSHGMSGRDLFTYNPELYNDGDESDDDNFDLDDYRKRTEEERDQVEAARVAALGGQVDSLAISDSSPTDPS